MYYNKFHRSTGWAVVKSYCNRFVQNPFRRIFSSPGRGVLYRTELCVVPFPYFNTYKTLLEDDLKCKDESDKGEKGLIQRLVPKFIVKYIHNSKGHNIYKETSVFVAIASDENSNNIFRQGDTVLEVMLQYKWRKYLLSRFIGVCLIHAIYYTSYFTGVIVALELYDYKSEEDDRSLSGGHLISIMCMFISGSLLLLQVVRQIIISRRLIDYFSSLYNWVDIVAFAFPIVTLLQLLYNWNKFYETCSIATLILWLHAILRLRVVSFVGIALETIIQLFKKVWSILCIFFLVVLAFTNSFIVLLRQREDTYFQETYNGTDSFEH